MAGTTPHAVTKLALLIDGDNISATYMPLIVREAEKIGVIAVRRIYGQFKSGKMKSWLKHTAEYDLIPVNVSPLTHGKNATDMKLVIEAMDMLHGRQLDGICIASSDGDFTPLAARIRGNAVAVYGFGAKKAPAGYKAEFDRFYECDMLIAAEKKTPIRRAAPSKSDVAMSPAATVAQSLAAARAAAPSPTAPRRTTRTTAVAKSPAPVQKPEGDQPKEVRGPRGKQQIPADVQREILGVIDRSSGADGYAHVRSVGNAITRAIPGFSAKPYGHRTIAGLLRTLPGVEVKDGSNGALVRRRPS